MPHQNNVEPVITQENVRLTDELTAVVHIAQTGGTIDRASLT